MLEALGVPSALRRAEGSGQRETMRHFHSNTIKPIAELIRVELMEKLEVEFDFVFPEAIVSDISARSRAFSSLIKAGVAPRDAAKNSGLPVDIQVQDMVSSDK